MLFFSILTLFSSFSYVAYSILCSFFPWIFPSSASCSILKSEASIFYNRKYIEHSQQALVDIDVAIQNLQSEDPIESEMLNQIYEAALQFATQSDNFTDSFAIAHTVDNTNNLISLLTETLSDVKENSSPALSILPLPSSNFPVSNNSLASDTKTYI